MKHIFNKLIKNQRNRVENDWMTDQKDTKKKSNLVTRVVHQQEKKNLYSRIKINTI